MLLKRILLVLFATMLLILSGAVFLYFNHNPDLQPRTEIYRGVYLTVENLTKSGEGDGKIMIVEVHWDTPGVQIANRQFDYPIETNDSAGSHYDLQFADFALRHTGASILMNSCLYHPGAALQSIPGRPVRSVETIVVNSTVSHVHEHSYLLYWDKSMNGHILQTKPPDRVSLESAVVGLGMQGVQVSDGVANFNAMGNKENVHARTFIGIDPEKRILYMMAFENVSGNLMIERAVDQGVVFGGQLDSGDSTNLLIGENAKGVEPHTGIRNLRPLGPYITIHADPL